MSSPLRVAIVSGEESGDLLGHDLVLAMARQSDRPVELVGVGGRHLQSVGLKPFFDPGDIALMGVSAVIKDLPRLLYRINTTAKAIAEAKPDCLITVDSPAFTLRVAKKVRALAPEIPIIKYVCPSVWAWGPGRASKMKPYVDRVLCILPFEVEVLDQLDGPAGIYVGHRLTSDPSILAAAEAQRNRSGPGGQLNLLVLPGSRRAEVTSLMKPFGEVLHLLQQRGHVVDAVIPTVPHVQALVSETARGWSITPRVVTGEAAKTEAFARADVAMAASGTVLLELALARVPMISCYGTDIVMKLASNFITTWTAALPNLIADGVVVPEFINDYLRPGLMTRHLEALMAGPARQAQLDGFERVASRMATTRPASEIAAEAVLGLIKTA